MSSNKNMEPLELLTAIRKVEAPDALLYKVQQRITHAKSRSVMSYTRVRAVAALLLLIVVTESFVAYQYLQHSKKQQFSTLVQLPDNALYE